MKLASKTYNRGGSFHPRYESGPVHALNRRLAWCGVRLRGVVAHWDGDLAEVTCRACKSALSAGKQRSWRSRR